MSRKGGRFGAAALVTVLLSLGAFAPADVVSSASPAWALAGAGAQPAVLPAAVLDRPQGRPPGPSIDSASFLSFSFPDSFSSRLAQINWLLLGGRTGSAGAGDAVGVGVGASAFLCPDASLPARTAAGVVPSLPPWPSGAGGTDGAAGGVVTELPPAPSSFALVLSAVASLGAYQGVRTLKRLHLGAGLSHLPDWYHADAVQIGHATPLQLAFDLSALPVCAFDAPAAERPLSPAAFERSRLDVGVFRVILAIPTRAPRSPPAC